MLQKIFGRDKDISELEEDRDKITVRRDIQTLETDIAERQALERELKAKYGPRWKKILGFKGKPLIPDMRSVLKDEMEASGRKIRSRRF